MKEHMKKAELSTVMRTQVRMEKGFKREEEMRLVTRTKRPFKTTCANSSLPQKCK